MSVETKTPCSDSSESKTVVAPLVPIEAGPMFKLVMGNDVFMVEKNWLTSVSQKCKEALEKDVEESEMKIDKSLITIGYSGRPAPHAKQIVEFFVFYAKNCKGNPFPQEREKKDDCDDSYPFVDPLTDVASLRKNCPNELQQQYSWLFDEFERLVKKYGSEFIYELHSFLLNFDSPGLLQLSCVELSRRTKDLLNEKINESLLPKNLDLPTKEEMELMSRAVYSRMNFDGDEHKALMKENLHLTDEAYSKMLEEYQKLIKPTEEEKEDKKEEPTEEEEENEEEEADE